MPSWTLLHDAARSGDLRAAKRLLSGDADPDAREPGDNTTPLHWAAAGGHSEIVRLLLDAGADVHGKGDVHELDAIGWSTYFGDSSTATLLLRRGARHHIFSAMACGKLASLRTVLRRDPSSTHRRMSHFEGRKSALHYAVELGRTDMLHLLIQAGAPLEAKDATGLTPLEAALSKGALQAAAKLQRAGAKVPGTLRKSKPLREFGSSVTRLRPMLFAADVAATLDWYGALGFEEYERYSDNGIVNFGVVGLGAATILINRRRAQGPHDVTLWFETNRIDEIYARLRHARALFVEHINDTFYHARQFAIRDCNGYILYFIQQKEA